MVIQSLLLITLFLFSQVSSQRIGGRRLFGKDVLRYAAFGGANVWGLGDHLANRFEAFPYLLSPTVDNYGAVSTGSNYDAVCLESLVGDDKVYDVILIDFCHVVEPNVLALARRLRVRFPKAHIIFIKYWRPLHVQHTDPTTNALVNLPVWLAQNGLDSWASDAFKSAVLADNGHWVDQRDVDGMASLYRSYAALVNATVVSLPELGTQVPQGLAEQGDYFARPTLMSAKGHQVMAKLVKEAVDSMRIDTNQATHGDFGKGDQCHVWFTTGGIKFPYNGANMIEFDQHFGKFALEFPGVGEIEVNNPFPDPRRLYLSFLVSHEEGVYQDVQILGGGIDTIISPRGKDVSNHHYVKTSAVGYFSPGTHTVQVHPQGKRAPNGFLFRLVGMTFSNEEVVPEMYTFAPIFSH